MSSTIYDLPDGAGDWKPDEDALYIGRLTGAEKDRRLALGELVTAVEVVNTDSMQKTLDISGHHVGVDIQVQKLGTSDNGELVLVHGEFAPRVCIQNATDRPIRCGGKTVAPRSSLVLREGIGWAGSVGINSSGSPVIVAKDVGAGRGVGVSASGVVGLNGEFYCSTAEELIEALGAEMEHKRIYLRADVTLTHPKVQEVPVRGVNRVLCGAYMVGVWGPEFTPESPLAFLTPSGEASIEFTREHSPSNEATLELGWFYSTTSELTIFVDRVRFVESRALYEELLLGKIYYEYAASVVPIEKLEENGVVRKGWLNRAPSAKEPVVFTVTSVEEFRVACDSDYLYKHIHVVGRDFTVPFGNLLKDSESWIGRPNERALYFRNTCYIFPQHRLIFRGQSNSSIPAAFVASPVSQGGANVLRFYSLSSEDPLQFRVNASQGISMAGDVFVENLELRDFNGDIFLGTDKLNCTSGRLAYEYLTQGSQAGSNITQRFWRSNTSKLKGQWESLSHSAFAFGGATGSCRLRYNPINNSVQINVNLTATATESDTERASFNTTGNPMNLAEDVRYGFAGELFVTGGKTMAAGAHIRFDGTNTGLFVYWANNPINITAGDELLINAEVFL